MNKNLFFSNHLIKSFLKELENNLMDLPFELRQQYLSEIKSDLYENALELYKFEKDETKIPSKVLNEYLEPNKLAREIVEEHKEQFINNHLSNNNSIKIFTGLSVAPLGALSIPILLGVFNLSAMLPFLIAFFVSTIWFVSNKKILWNSQMLNYLKKMINFSQSILISLGFGFFGIRIITTKQLDMFSLYYLIIYLLSCACYILFLRHLYKKNQFI
ncbi:hypothetical protein [Bacillus mycoides]|uniref:hypothetical protein n=1 Tax=Bacillus mycoides TaxID=1405 RepID=UPI001C01180C|nr:hypothetical protein [Bacillus mycoides]QWG87703.1 hypothetical protein EXW61_31055 [Bacillus mycoides]